MKIRLITQEDVPAFYDLVKRNYFHIRDYFPKTIVASDSLTACRKLVDEFIAKASKRQMFVFLSEDDSHQLTGTFFIKEVDIAHSKAEIAYFVDEAHEGHGIATAGVHELLDFVFKDLMLNKAVCRVSTDNAGSNAVALKNGFVLEGVLRKEFRISTGNFIDINCYGLVNEK